MVAFAKLMSSMSARKDGGLEVEVPAGWNYIPLVKSRHSQFKALWRRIAITTEGIFKQASRS